MAVAPFFARGDTATPVKAALIAVAINIAAKILLMGPLAQVGLALATTIGAWINFGLVVWLGLRAGFTRPDRELMRSTGKLAVAGLALAAALWLAARPVATYLGDWRLRDLVGLTTLAVLGLVVYGAAILALFGRRWLTRLRSEPRPG